MDLRKNIMMIVSVMVAVIIALSVLVPVIQDTSASEDTFTNEGFFYARALNSDSTDILEWDPANPTKLVINNVEVDTTTIDSSYSNVTVAFSNDWFIRFALDTTVIYLYEADSEVSSSTDYASVSNEKTFNMTCLNGVATITIGDATYNETIQGDGLIISPDKADYVMKKSTTKAYVVGDSVVYGSGRTDRALGVQGTSFNAMFKASVDEGVIPIAYSPNTYTVTDSSVTYTDIAGGTYVDLYELTDYKITITDGTNSGTITYNQIFVPTEVNAERSVHVSTIEASLLGIIPLLVVIGIVIGAVWFIRQKN